MRVRTLIESDWSGSTLIERAGAWKPRILWRQGLRPRFEHYCKIVDGDQLVIAPVLGNEVLSRDPVTLKGSVLCPDCGLHGYIEDGRWRDA